MSDVVQTWPKLVSEALKKFGSSDSDSDAGTLAFRYFMKDVSSGETSFEDAWNILLDDKQVQSALDEAATVIEQRDFHRASAHSRKIDDITHNIAIINETSGRLEQGMSLVRETTEGLKTVGEKVAENVVVIGAKAERIETGLEAMQKATAQLQALTEAAALQSAVTSQVAARLETAVLNVQSTTAAMRVAGTEISQKVDEVITNTSTKAAIAVGTKVGYRTGFVTGAITGTITGLVTGMATGVLVTIATPWINTHLMGMPPNGNNAQTSTATPACVSSDPPDSYRIDIGGDLPKFSFVAPGQNFRVVLGKPSAGHSHRPQRHRVGSACYATLKR